MRSLTWDRSNRLSGVTTSGGAATLFAYGSDGGRVKKSSAFTTTLYAEPEVEIEASVPGSETCTLLSAADAPAGSEGSESQV